MAADLLTNNGEEWMVETNVNGATVTVGLYDDSTDSLGETNDVADVTTEPTGSNYARQSSTVTTGQFSGDFGFQNDSLLSFDTSNSSQTVDNTFWIVNFQADTVSGDTSATDHIVALASLSQSRNLSDIDTLEIAANSLQLTIS